MKKKYVSPDIKLIKIGQEVLAAGSGDTLNGELYNEEKYTGAANAKRFMNHIWDNQE